MRLLRVCNFGPLPLVCQKDKLLHFLFVVVVMGWWWGDKPGRIPLPLKLPSPHFVSPLNPPQMSWYMSIIYYIVDIYEVKLANWFSLATPIYALQIFLRQIIFKMWKSAESIRQVCRLTCEWVGGTDFVCISSWWILVKLAVKVMKERLIHGSYCCWGRNFEKGIPTNFIYAFCHQWK